MINPFTLLNVTIDSSFNTLKRNYYNMALFCHPDKGGSNDDMIVLHNAYNYCKKQLQLRESKQTTYEELESEFINFCKEQEEKAPTFSSIYKETNDWIEEFNNHFDNLNIKTDGKDFKVNPFQTGYGGLMDTSEDISELPSYEDKEETLPSQIFNKEIVEYKEPQYLPDSINYYPLNCDKIDDFSGSTENNQLIMTDYYKSYGKHKKIKENDFKFTNYPNYNMEYNMNL